MEASYEADVPEIKLAPNLMPMFRRQYDNNVFTGNMATSPLTVIITPNLFRDQ